jgi:hypothetical protein
MVQDIQSANYRLPDFTHYNGGDIPFAYSPLSLYLAAVIEALTPLSLTDVFRLLPFAGALFATWAFWRLAAVLLPSRNAALAATAIFAVVPRSFIWLLMGGGLPRGLALGLAILAIREGYLLTRGPVRWRSVATLSVYAALTAITHLETAAFVLLTFLLFVCMRPSRLLHFAVAAAGAAALSAPWWALVISRHGIAPFRASTEYGGDSLSGGLLDIERLLFVLRNPVFTDEQFFPIVGALAVVGAFYALARRLWFLPAWWLLIMMADMRAYPTYAALPVTLLAGLLVVEGLAASVSSYRRREESISWRWPALAAALAALFLLNGALEHSRYDARFLHSLPQADREAFAWVREETPPDALFTVVPVSGWYADYASEWFPALAERESAGTAQGYEWVPGGFEARLAVHDDLWACASSTAVCLEAVMRDAGATFAFVPSECCSSLARSIRLSSSFEVVYQDGGAIVVVLSNTGRGRDRGPGPSRR